MIEDLFLHSSSDRPRLRVGVIVDDVRIAPPGLDVLSQLRRADFVEFVVVVLKGCAPTAGALVEASRATVAQSVESRVPAIFGWYRRWDRRRVARESRSFEARDCSQLIADIPLVRYEHTDQCGENIRQITDYRLDVLVHLGSSEPLGSISKAARYGVWSIRWGDATFSGTPAYFWEMVGRRTLIAVTLCMLGESRASKRVLATLLTRTESYASLVRNSFTPFVAARTLVLQKLHQLHQYGWERVVCDSVIDGEAIVRTDRYATNPEMLKFLSAMLFEQTRLRMQLAKTVEHWQVALRRDANATAHTSAEGYLGIDAPPGHYFADPFIVEDAGRTLLFVEDFNYATHTGAIVCLEVGSDGSLGEPVRVIERPYHCSYPQVIRESDQWFMVPETGFNGTVELYAAIDFPYRWRLEKVLFRGAAFDTTIVQQDGLYWFFVTLIDRAEYYCPQLFLFHAESLTGTWTLHPGSPISRDVRTARCGGAIIRDGDRLIRVAQDGGVAYGRGLRFMEITKLNRSEFAEREVADLTCDRFPGTIGVHTYNRCGDIEVVDLKRRVPRRPPLFG